MKTPQPSKLVHTAQDAIILCLLTAAAVDGAPQDREIALIEAIANTSPALAMKTTDEYRRMMEIGLALIGGPDGLDTIFSLATLELSRRARATCFALVVEFIARNGKITAEEMRFLDLLADHFKLNKLTRAAIEQAARIRLDPLSDKTKI